MSKRDRDAVQRDQGHPFNVPRTIGEWVTWRMGELVT